MAMILLRAVREFSMVDAYKMSQLNCILEIKYPCEGVSVMYVYCIKLY